MATLNKPKILSLLTQKSALQRAFPESNGRVRRNRLYWSAVLQPTGISEFYDIELTYSLEMPPKVFVQAPKLQTRDNEKIPHRYPDCSLCLYLPRNGEWNSSMYVAETTVPWACEWLFHYELWLATGEWLGGGVHPGDNKRLNEN